MKAPLQARFGTIPADAENLEIVGALTGRMETWDNVTVWPGSGVLRRADDSVVFETLWQAQHLGQCGDYLSKWSWLPRSRPGVYFNLSLFWWPNYYHWICDVLARLHRVLPHLKPDAQIILPPGLAAWQKRSLELLGLPLDRCVQYAGRRPWQVEKLFYVSPVTMTGDHEEKSLRWVRDTIWQNCPASPPVKAGWRKLYLRRSNTRSRTVVNEAELLPPLLARGFEVVDCGTLSFDEQVRWFSEAACVVGPHGAAFTNMLWSPPGLQVFEIFEPASVRRCYWSMCQTLGHHHACGIGQPVAQEGKEANIRVPVKDLIRAVENAGVR